MWERSVGCSQRGREGLQAAAAQELAPLGRESQVAKAPAPPLAPGPWSPSLPSMMEAATQASAEVRGVPREDGAPHKPRGLWRAPGVGRRAAETGGKRGVSVQAPGGEVGDPGMRAEQAGLAESSSMALGKGLDVGRAGPRIKINRKTKAYP